MTPTENTYSVPDDAARRTVRGDGFADDAVRTAIDDAGYEVAA